MSDAFKEYIERTSKIRFLSSPSLKDIDNADADNAVFVLSESEFEAFYNADSYSSEHLGGYCILHKH